jgi:tRNA A-37 threonylcarbamoyl transferase component Bud32/tetratricopeptide (TPR) repeat protein
MEIPAAEPLPEAIGPYRIVREIGRGGMGRVYLAEHRGEDFRRPVAVKRLDRRESSPLFERRFRDEVKFLASLEHPGIARFLDGGRAKDGSAYLVLEYVEGSDLLTYARERSLAIDDRLRLVLEVLAAVEFAHARRIVHRDLKPGNILVGTDGHPKLLDFGISKLVDPGAEASEETRTRTELRALTPAYASPEQIRGEAVTVASDVYSLGVMLYELLSGLRPFRSASGDARELERAVLEQDPEPPSTAARRAAATSATSPAGEAGRAAGGAADDEPPLAPSDAATRLGRDLDAICLKALRKEPSERYRSVAALADDLRNFLAGRPVEAHRGGLAYRTAKRLRRHRTTVAVGMSAALLATVVVLLTVRVPGGPELEGPARAAAAQAPRPTAARIDALAAVAAEGPGRPEAVLELAEALLAAGRGAEAMAAVARLRGLPDRQGKGPRIDLVEAEAALAVSEYQHAAAVASSAREGAERTGDTALARRAELAQGRALLRLSPPDEVDRRMAALYDAAEAAGDEPTAIAALVLRALAARRAAHAGEAGRLVADALPRARAAGEKRLEAQALILKGRLQGESGAVEQGLQTIEAALAIAIEANDVAAEAGALQIKMALLNWAGKDDAAMAVGKLAVERLRLSGDREQLLSVLSNFAIGHVDRAEFRDAEAAIAEAEPLARSLGNPRHRGAILRARGYLDEQRGDTDAARASYTAAIAAGREAGVDAVVATYLNNLAWLELNAERYDAAAAAAQEAAGLFRRGGDERSALEVEAVLACADAFHGDHASARRRLEELTRKAAESDSDSAQFMVHLAGARVAELAKEFPRALELRRKSVELARGFGLPGLLASVRADLAVALDRVGDRAAAVALARELLPEAERLGQGAVVRDCRRILDRAPAPSS